MHSTILKLLKYFWCLGFLSPGNKIFVLDHAALFSKTIYKTFAKLTGNTIFNNMICI